MERNETGDIIDTDGQVFLTAAGYAATGYVTGDYAEYHQRTGACEKNPNWYKDTKKEDAEKKVAGDAAAKSPDAGACVCMFVILYPSLIENLMLCTDAALSQTQSFDALSQTQSFDTVDGDDDALTLLHGAAGAGAPPSYLYLGMRPDF